MDHSRYISAEPKLQVHQSPLLLTNRSSSLRSMIERQMHTLEELRKDALGDDGDGSKDESNSQSTGWHETFELASGHVWSESDDDDTTVPKILPDPEIHDSIEAIREEASRVDAAIALDKLDTMKDEMASLKKELNTRDFEIKGLRSMIQVKDSRLSTLELERDLYRADMTAGNEFEDESKSDEELLIDSPQSLSKSCDDADDAEETESPKLRNHFKALLDETRRGRLLLSQSEDTPPRIKTPNAQRLGRKHQKSPVHTSAPGSFGIAPRSVDHWSIKSPPTAPPTTLHFRSSRSMSSSPSRQSLASYSTRSGNDVPSKKGMETHLRSRQKHQEPRTPNNSMEASHIRSFTPSTAQTTPVAEARRLATPESRGSPYLLVRPARPSPMHLRYGVPTLDCSIAPPTTPSPDAPSLSSRDSQREHGRPLFRMDEEDEDSAHGNSELSKTALSHLKRMESRPYPLDLDTGRKTCLPLPTRFLRRNKRKKASTPRQKEQGTPYQNHASELTQLLRTSLDTSDELRKRLAMISAYYESVVEELQHNIETNHAESQEVERELVDQIRRMQLEQESKQKGSAKRRHPKRK
mmetsp:Transcript_20735/g.57302  ORF Transcript_20735/g.57302 Transcript_20735/m.57302 type:complete len:582 (-) Transcript_20735:2077-3822(-)